MPTQAGIGILLEREFANCPAMQQRMDVLDGGARSKTSSDRREAAVTGR